MEAVNEEKNLGRFLAVVIISSALSGCGRDALPDSQENIVPEIAGNTEVIETSAPTQATVNDTTEPTTEAKSDFDFEKTLEQTYICGQKLSYPLTLGKLGEDFSIDPEGACTSPKSGNVTCSINYKGQYLGCFIFKGCESVDAITDDIEISNILIQNEDMANLDDQKISVNGVTLNSTHKDLYEALGSSYEIGIDESQINYCDDSLKFHFGFGKFKDNEDKLVTVLINLKK